VPARPVHHVLEVVVVVGVGSAAVVVAIVMEHDEHRVGGIGVVLLVLVHHLLIQQRAISAAAVFVSFIARPGDGDDLAHAAGIGIDVLHVVRAIAERRADFARGPEVVELNPGAAARRGIGVYLIGLVGGEQA